MRQIQRALPIRPVWRGLTRLLTWEDDLSKVAQIVKYEPHPGQLEIHRNRARWRAVSNGRRFGKSTLSAFETVAVAALGGWVMCAAPTYDLSSKVFNEAAQMILRSPIREIVHTYHTAKGDQLIILESGGRIVGKSTDNPKSLVGDGWDLIVLDEAAKEPDPEVWHRQLRPALMDRGGSALFPTTPEGDNWFKEIFDKGQARVKGYASWQMPSSANPLLPPDEIESLAEGMTELDYQQEILAIFLDATGGVFRGYRDVSNAHWQENPIPGHRYAIGVDIAQHKDWTVIAIFDLTLRCFVHLIRFNQISYPIQEEYIADAAAKWRAPVMIDATNNEAVAEHLAEKIWIAPVEAFKFTQLTKQQVVNQLSLAIERKEIGLLASDQEVDGMVLDKDDDRVILCKLALSEIGSYRYERSPSGILRMNAPQGRHDDIVIAKVLAYQMALQSSGGAPIVAHTVDRPPTPSIQGRFSGATPVATKAQNRGRPFQNRR